MKDLEIPYTMQDFKQTFKVKYNYFKIYISKYHLKIKRYTIIDKFLIRFLKEMNIKPKLYLKQMMRSYRKKLSFFQYNSNPLIICGFLINECKIKNLSLNYICKVLSIAPQSVILMQKKLKKECF